MTPKKESPNNSEVSEDSNKNHIVFKVYIDFAPKYCGAEKNENKYSICNLIGDCVNKCEICNIIERLVNKGVKVCNVH